MSTTANHLPARHSSRSLVSVSNAAGRGRLEMQVFGTIAFDDLKRKRPWATQTIWDQPQRSYASEPREKQVRREQ